MHPHLTSPPNRKTDHGCRYGRTRPASSLLSIVLPVILLGGALTGCAAQLSPQQKADHARRDRCEDYANRIYRQQNRDLLSRGDETGTPFSAGGNRAAPSAGLSELYSQDRLINNCMADGGPPSADTVRDIRASTEAILNAPR